MIRGVIPLTALLFLGGCTGEADIYAVVQDRAYSPSEFHRAAQGKTLRVTVAGNPFAESNAELSGNVLRAMQPVNWWYSEAFTPRVQFAGLDTEHSAPRYHIAVRFGDDGSAPSDYCSNDPDTAAARQGETVARLSFCRGATLLSTSHGTLPKGAGSSDPAFGKMITRMTMALFPQRRDTDSCSSLRNNGRC